MGRRHAILVAVMIGLALLLVPASPLFSRAPDLLIPAFVAYGMAFLAAFRLVIGRPLGAEMLAAAGLRTRPVKRGRLRRAAGLLFTLFIALLVVLASSAGALWLRSHRVEDRVEWDRWYVLAVTPSRWVRRFHDRIYVRSDRGRVAYQRTRNVSIDPRYVLDKQKTFRPVPWQKLTWSDGLPLRALGVTVPPTPTRAPTGQSPVLDALGIEYVHSTLPRGLPNDPSEGDTWLVVPWWLICVAFALPPLCVAGVYVMRLRGVKPGHCAHCGYDLRATPGRCPECGEGADETSASRGMAATHA